MTPTALHIALRYLFAPKSHTAVNVITMISMAGIAVAAMAMVCVMSVFNGFTDLAAERLSAFDPDLRVSPRSGRVITHADSLAAVLARIPGVRAAAPVMEQKALVMFGEAQLPVTVKGVPDDYGAVTALSPLLIDGIEVPGCALFSIGAALNSGVRPSAERPVVFTVPRRTGRVNPALPLAAFVTDTILVSGVFQTNQQEIDDDLVILPLSDARRLFDYSDAEATSVELALEPGADAGKAAAAVAAAVGEGCVVADRMQQQEASFRMIKIEKWLTFAMLLFVLVMASFNILSTMSMLIIEKEDNMHVLRAMGASPTMCRHIFLYEGILVAVIGGLVGILAGVILSLLQQHFGLIELGGDHSHMSVTAYPCRLAATDTLLTLAVVITIGLLSGKIAERGVK